MVSKRAYMFVDESGVASLNRKSDLFLLGIVIIDKVDFEIVEGYLRLLKRKYFKDDHVTLHANEIFEKNDKYPSLSTAKKMNSFLGDLAHFLTVVPYSVRFYSIDKPSMLKELNYTPAPKKKVKDISIDLPYERASIKAIHDFAMMLEEQNKTGEIVIESRLFSDAKFVSYFDSARQKLMKGNVINPKADITLKRVTSLSIANKMQINGGLEIADLCCYIQYRILNGDPDNRLAISITKLESLAGVIKKHTFSLNKGVRSLVVTVIMTLSTRCRRISLMHMQQ